MELPELTKEMEKSIRDHFSTHDPAKKHEYFPCSLCVILMLLAEVDKLRAENMQLRVNP